MGNMSVVALTVSSGCHIASAAFKSTLFGNVAPQCCFKNTRGDVQVKEEEEKKNVGFWCKTIAWQEAALEVVSSLGVGEVFKAKASG